MTAGNDPTTAASDTAAMLMMLGADRNGVGSSARVSKLFTQPIDVRQIVEMCRPLGLLIEGDRGTIDAASQTGEADGGALHLKFGPLPLLIRWGATSADRPDAFSAAASAQSTIWQGVDRSAGDDMAWLTLEAQAPADSDRVNIAQSLCSVTALLAQRLASLGTAVTQLCWLPNMLWTDPAHLAAAVIAVERQGLPPVMHLIGFIPTGDGRVITRGMNWFGLEDMIVGATPAMPVAEIVRRATRLAAEQMAMRAPLLCGRYPGIERGEWIAIERGETDPDDTDVDTDAVGTGSVERRAMCHAVVEQMARG